MSGEDYTGMKPFGVNVIEKSDAEKLAETREALKKQTIAHYELLKRNNDLLHALRAAVECGMVPTSSAREGGANKHVIQLQVADLIRDTITKEESYR